MNTYEEYKAYMAAHPPKEWDKHVVEQRHALMTQWITECCRCHPIYEESSRELYNSWVLWLNGPRPPIRMFVADLREMQFYGALLMNRRLRVPRLMRGRRGLQLREPKFGQVLGADGVLRYPR